MEERDLSRQRNQAKYELPPWIKSSIDELNNEIIELKQDSLNSEQRHASHHNRIVELLASLHDMQQRIQAIEHRQSRPWYIRLLGL